MNLLRDLPIDGVLLFLNRQREQRAQNRYEGGN